MVFYDIPLDSITRPYPGGKTLGQGIEYLAESTNTKPYEWRIINLRREASSEQAVFKSLGKDHGFGGTTHWSWRKATVPLYIPFLTVDTHYSFARADELHFPVPPVIECWQGLLEVSHFEDDSKAKRDKVFYIASLPSTRGEFPDLYYANVDDETLIAFLREVFKEHVAIEPDDGMVTVVSWNTDDVNLSLQDETVILPPHMYEEILGQVDMFYQSKQIYQKLRLPYRRGLLFTGPPGNGKTLMCRQIIRHAYRQYKAEPYTIAVNNQIDEHTLSSLMRVASTQTDGDVPSVVILEDVESLTRETNLTRSGFLNILDGVASDTGILIVATTNYPEALDEALLHRPSRFDRVWRFRLPTEKDRISYLQATWPELDSQEDFVKQLAKDTENWSFAYLNELRLASAFRALHSDKGSDIITREDIRASLENIQAQFESIDTGKVLDPGHTSPKVGFGQE